MADDESEKGAQDRTRMNVNEKYEVAYWSKKFGVSANQLRTAVSAVGVQASAVEKHFRSSGARLLFRLRSSTALSRLVIDWLRLGHLRDLNRENAIVEARFDLPLLDLSRQLDAPHEVAELNLSAQVGIIALSSRKEAG